MPTLATMRIPRPKNWDEFQEIATSALKSRWTSPTLQQYGRQGQSQQGVDIFGPDHLGRPSGIQCKCQDSIDEKVMDAEIDSAETFQPKLSNFYFAVAGPRDAKAQQYLRLLSESRILQGKFAVGIFFWDDLLEDLTKDPAEFKKHFPSLRLDGEPAVDVHTLIFGAYDVAYHGVDVRHSIDLIFGEAGVMVDENPLQLEHMMRTIEASAQGLLTSDRHRDLVLQSRLLVETAMAARDGTKDWDKVDGIAGSIETIVRAMEYSLTGLPLLALDLGFAMRQWEHVSGIPGKAVPQDLRDRLVTHCEKLSLSAETVEEVKEAIDKFNADLELGLDNIQWRTYNVVRRAIRALRFAAPSMCGTSDACHRLDDRSTSGTDGARS